MISPYFLILFFFLGFQNMSFTAEGGVVQKPVPDEISIVGKVAQSIVQDIRLNSMTSEVLKKSLRIILSSIEKASDGQTDQLLCMKNIIKEAQEILIIRNLSLTKDSEKRSALAEIKEHKTRIKILLSELTRLNEKSKSKSVQKFKDIFYSLALGTVLKKFGVASEKKNARFSKGLFNSKVTEEIREYEKEESVVIESEQKEKKDEEKTVLQEMKVPSKEQKERYKNAVEAFDKKNKAPLGHIEFYKQQGDEILQAELEAALEISEPLLAEYQAIFNDLEPEDFIEEGYLFTHFLSYYKWLRQYKDNVSYFKNKLLVKRANERLRRGLF